jgi:hypothetical protein
MSTKAHDEAPPTGAAIRSQQRQRVREDMPPDYGVHELVAWLAKRANLGAKDKKHYTDDERSLLDEHGDKLPDALAELTKILTDGQPAHVQEYRLYKLHVVVGSACLIAAYLTMSPRAADEIDARVAQGTAGTKRKSSKIDDIIAAEAARYPDDGPWKAAPKICLAVDRRLKDEGVKLKRQMTPDTIARRLKKLYRMDATSVR